MARVLGLFLGAATAAGGQVIPPDPSLSGDVAVTYHWVRSNTQPGDCGCFSLNGGGLSASWNVLQPWAVVGEISGEYSGSGPSIGNTLTLASYLAGARYTLPQPWLNGAHALRPFIQALIGVAHAGGGIAGAGDGAAAFATRIGGGIDVPVSRRFAIRIVQIDYYLTTFDNTAGNHQDNLLLGAGIVYHWSVKD